MADIIGKHFGNYKIIREIGKNKHGHRLYEGECIFCGFRRIARTREFERTSTCTHIRKYDYCSVVKNTHWKNQRLCRIYNGMYQRCYSPRNKHYEEYGGRGIKICEEWLKNPLLFEEWSLDNGYDSSLSIDRINCNQGYCPENCRWIPMKENAKWHHWSYHITIDEITDTASGWSRRIGRNRNYISRKIRFYGMEATIAYIKEELNK